MRVAILAVLTVCLTVAACKSKPSLPFVGTWTVDVTATAAGYAESTKGRLNVDAPAEEQADFQKIFLDELAKGVTEAYGASKLAITNDGKYTLSWTYKGEAINEAGTWTASEKELTLNCQTVNGKTDRLPKAKTVTLDASGKSVTLTDPESALTGTLRFAGGPLHLVRSAARN